MYSSKSKVNELEINRLIKFLGDNLLKYELIIDSRLANPNSIFCAYPGNKFDGRDYINAALECGVKAVIYEAGYNSEINVPHIATNGLIYYVGLLAAAKYNYPGRLFNTIGVTGTNGKTTVTHWITQMYSFLGNKTAIIGTTGAGVYPQLRDYTKTTPDPITLQQLFYEFVLKHIDIVSMEVSSHALTQGRVNGVCFKTAVFTNLTQDHLDYHHTMEDYYQAKASFFYWHNIKHRVINCDDDYGKKLIAELKQHQLDIISYGIYDGDIRAFDITYLPKGITFKVQYKNNVENVCVNVLGKFNIYNVLAVIGSLIVDGYSLANIVPLLTKITTVKGRMDTIAMDNQPLIVIDFAHTPDALLNVLNTLRQITRGRLYCVFGCGGDRDIAKRPLMGKISTLIADFTYLTSDNPRSEEPQDIIQQIVAGVTSNNFAVVPNREDAITMAITNSKIGDIVLIAGKGHEDYQDIKGVKYPFSDYVTAKKIIGCVSK